MKMTCMEEITKTLSQVDILVATTWIDDIFSWTTWANRDLRWEEIFIGGLYRV